MAKKKKGKIKSSPGKGSQISGKIHSACEQAAEPPGLVKPDEPLPSVYRIALVLIFGLLFLLAFRQVSSLDVGFHLRAGNYILEGNGWPSTDPFSYTCSNHRYVDSQWAYQIILAIVQRIGDSAAIVVFHAVLVLILFYLLYRTARLTLIDPATLVFLFLLSAAAVEFRFIVRPELMSWVFLAGVLYILHRYAEGFGAPLWALPILMLVWVNCHSGFILGWGAIGCFFLGLWLKKGRFDKELFKWGVISVAVTIINPYHIEGVLFPLRGPLKLLTNVESGNPFYQYIGELVSPFTVGDKASAQFPFYPYTIIVPYFTLLVVSVVAVVRLLYWRKYWLVLLFVPFFYLSAKMIRNIPLWVIACLPFMIQGLPLGRVLQLMGWDEKRYKWVAGAMGIFSMLVTLGFAAYTITDAHYLSTRRSDRFGWGWNRNILPVEEMEFINKVGIKGPVLNHFNFGGYMMWATSHKTFMDGRLEVFGQKFYGEYKRCFIPKPDKREWRQELEACVARWDIRWAVYPYDINPELLNMMSHDSAWRLAHFGPRGVMFVRNGPGVEQYIDPNLDQSLIPSTPPDLRTLPGLFGNRRPSAFKRFVAGFFEKQVFPTRHHMMGLFHYFRHELPEAYAHFTKAIQESRGYYYETYNNLGSVLFRMGRFDAARQCYEIVLQEDSKNPIATSRLAQIEQRR